MVLEPAYFRVRCDRRWRRVGFDGVLLHCGRGPSPCVLAPTPWAHLDPVGLGAQRAGGDRGPPSKVGILAAASDSPPESDTSIPWEPRSPLRPNQANGIRGDGWILGDFVCRDHRGSRQPHAAGTPRVDSNHPCGFFRCLLRPRLRLCRAFVAQDSPRRRGPRALGERARSLDRRERRIARDRPSLAAYALRT